jgi:hypothetical protein
MPDWKLNDSPSIHGCFLAPIAILDHLSPQEKQGPFVSGGSRMRSSQVVDMIARRERGPDVHFLLSWVAAGLLALLVDVVIARWNICVNRGHVREAMIWSAISPVLAFASLWICLGELSALLPNALGCAAGTYLAMRWK